MGILNGTLVLLKTDTAGGSGATSVSLQTEASISIEQEELDVTNKESGGFTAVIAGRRSGSISFTAFLDLTEDNNLEEMTDFFNAASTTARGTLMDFTFGNASSPIGAGEFEMSGSGLLTSVELGANTEESIQISGSITLSGQYTFTYGS